MSFKAIKIQSWRPIIDIQNLDHWQIVDKQKENYDFDKSLTLYSILNYPCDTIAGYTELDHNIASLVYLYFQTLKFYHSNYSCDTVF